jgi:cytochrome c551/c552
MINHAFTMLRHVLTLAFTAALGFTATALEIQLPPETGAFKQDAGAEIANGQCLVCHSVEYVTTQPPMQRAFWKASIVKMQQKYAAPIPDNQVEALADYLTKNYGVWTNGTSTSTALAAPATNAAPVSLTSTNAGLQLATQYGCIGCHGNKVKIVGPPYHEVALKYASDPDAVNKINEQIHKGGSGKWGPIIMPPFPQINAAETKVLANWILSLK